MKRFYFILIILSACAVLFAQETADDIAFDAAFKRMAVKFSSADVRLKNKTVAIYGFDVNGRPNDSFAAYSTEKITHELVENGKLKVVERSRIDRILKEQQFFNSGAVDADYAAKIGKLLAVDAVIIGTIRVTDTGIEFIARMVSSESGIIVTSANERLKSVAAITPPKKDTKPDNSTDNKSEPTAAPSYDSKADMSADKNSYTSEEWITVKYSGMWGSKTDWITLVNADAADSTYGEWFYTNGAKSGSYTFKPVPAGDYEVRAYFDWPKGDYNVKKRMKVKVKQGVQKAD